MSVKEKLVRLMQTVRSRSSVWETAGDIADYLIAHGVTVQEWIPASEPPKESGEYIVMIRDGAIATTLFYSEYCKVWCEFNDDEHENPYNVTHWMPLPQPPKGE